MKYSLHIFWSFLLLLPFQILGQPGVSDNAFQLFVPAQSNLKHALDKLSSQYDVEFSYPSDIASTQIAQSKTIQGSSLPELLNILLAQTDIHFQVQANNRILLRRQVQPRPAKDALVLTGKVLDKEAGIPLSHVMVYTEQNPQLGTLTDTQGSFSLPIPGSSSDELINIKLLGYEPIQVSASELQSNPSVSLSIKPFSLSEIHIEDKFAPISFHNDDLSVGIRSLPGGFTSNLLGNDLLRGVQLLPGVSADDDLSADIKIRGSEADETLIVLDGIPIYKAEHFFGIFSSINSEYVSEAYLYKNNLPIEYGGKTGGMVLLQSDSQVDKLGTKLDLNALTASLRLNVPIGDRMGMILQGRTTYSNAANSKFFNLFEEESTFYIPDFQDFARKSLIDINPSFRFYDLNGKVYWQPTPDQYLDLNFFHSRDQLNTLYEASYATRVKQKGAANTEMFDQQNDWSNTGFSFNYRNSLAANWSMKSRLFFSRYQNTNDIHTSYYQHREGNSLDWKMSNDLNNGIQDVGGEVSFTHQLEEGQSIQLGTGLVNHQSTLMAQQQDHMVLESDNEANEVQLFANYSISDDSWQINAGGRLTYYSLTNTIYLSPRISMSFDAHPNLSFKAAFNQDNQFVREIIHENQIGQGIDFLVLSNDNRFPISQVSNYMLGATYSRSNWSLDVEFFNKRLTNVLENALVTPGFSSEGGSSCGGLCDYNTFHGTGRAYGMDMILSYENSFYSGYVAYTLSKATQSFPEILGGEDFPSPNDRRHQLKWINTLTIGRFQLSGNYILSSGQPYTDFSILNRNIERAYLKPESRIRRLPAYQRLDVGLSYSFLIAGLKASTGLSVFNLTDHKNIRSFQYFYAIPSSDDANQHRVIGTRTNLLDRTFNLSFKLDI